MRSSAWEILLVFALAAVCGKTAKTPQALGFRFKDDLSFLQKYTKVVVLSDLSRREQVAVNPDLQGRVMTSTADGEAGLSFGWINRELLAAAANNPHINAFGGEDRIWLGPEGGQFSVFFKKGDPFDLDHWFTPPAVNEGVFDVVSQGSGQIRLRKSLSLTNYSGAKFDLEIDRSVRLLDNEALGSFGLTPPQGVRKVVYQSYNQIKNTGAAAWKRDTGLLSIWILGMFNPSSATTVVMPFAQGSEAGLGPVVNDAYFGKVPADRLVIRAGAIYFKGDGLHRSKIGISPKRAKPFLGSYDAANGTLTIVHLTLPTAPAEYVNSMWEIQKDPFAGDAINSYNDGPASPGAKPLGPFYELESSSPATALKPGEALVHIHTTMHFQGEEKALDAVARAALGVGIADIKAAFGRK